VIGLKKPNTTKWSDHCTINLTAQTAMIRARILRSRIVQFRFTTGKDAIGMLKISE
jgi:hypothetical protein